MNPPRTLATSSAKVFSGKASRVWRCHGEALYPQQVWLYRVIKAAASTFDSAHSEHQSSSLTRLSRYADDVHVYPRDSARIMKTKCDLWLSWISPSWNNKKKYSRTAAVREDFFFFRHLTTLYCFGSAETDDSFNISTKLLDFLRNVQTVRIPRFSQPSPSAAAAVLKQKAWKSAASYSSLVDLRKCFSPYSYESP